MVYPDFLFAYSSCFHFLKMYFGVRDIKFNFIRFVISWIIHFFHIICQLVLLKFVVFVVFFAYCRNNLFFHDTKYCPGKLIFLKNPKNAGKCE